MEAAVTDFVDDDWAFEIGRLQIERMQTLSSALTACDPLEFRRNVARFATGVAVITTEDEYGDWHGATVNSFGSISLDPPTVLVSLRAGRAHDAIKATQRFAASILGRQQEEHSNHFAGNRNGTPRPNLSVRRAMPTLQDCIAWFECEVFQEVRVHDHVLFLATVAACGQGDGDPLIFYDSGYTGRETGNAHR